MVSVDPPPTKTRDGKLINGSMVNPMPGFQALDILIETGREIPVSPEAGGDVLTTRSVQWLKKLLKSKGQKV